MPTVNEIELWVPAGKAVHAILDNYAAHKHTKVRAWLDRHPRWTFHFVPTSCSWLNAVEGFFAKLAKRRLNRGVTLDSQEPTTGKKERLASVLDFACGSGSLLLNVRKRMGPHGIGRIYGQEKNITTYNLARMNMLLHGDGTKQAQVIAMLRRKQGATVAQIVEATGWRPHTVRGMFAGALKKTLGLEVTSEKVEPRGRVYKLPPV